MNIALGRRYRKRQGAFSALLARNPVLVLGFDLPFVIVCATTLKTAVAMSMEMMIIHMTTMVVAMITVRTLPTWARVMVNVGFATIMMTIARHLITPIFPDLSNYVGVYIYLMAVNGLTLFESANLSRKMKLWPVMVSALMNALAFAMIMILVAFLRELFGSGTLWGVAVTLPIKLGGLQIPFSGFIMMGFLLAFAKFFNKKMLALTISESIRRDARYTEIDR